MCCFPNQILVQQIQFAHYWGRANSNNNYNFRIEILNSLQWMDMLQRHADPKLANCVALTFNLNLRL